MTRYVAHFTVIAGAALIGACSWLGIGKPPVTAMQSLRVIAFPAANGHMATAVDVVFVYGEEVMPLLPKRAPEWFERKAELLYTAPGDIEVVSYQIPPGHVVDQVALPARHGSALRVVAYANHVEGEGQHAVNLTSLQNAVLWLDAVAVGAAEEGTQLVSSDK